MTFKKKIIFSWPEGKTGAVTSSWDDGTEFDRKLVEIFNRYGLRGMFNLNSGKLGRSKEESGWKNYVSAEEVKDLYAGHEVAVHTVTHPWLQRLTDDQLLREIYEDRKRLEELMGYPVTGFVIPFGAGRERLMPLLKPLGFDYCRKTAKTEDFELPEDFMNWETTMHCGGDFMKLWDAFLECKHADKCFNFWGHSYEFDDRQDWGRLEAFCAKVAESDDVWHATYFEVFNYVMCWRVMDVALDGNSVRNRGSVTVWFRCDGELMSVAPGEVVRV